MVKYSKKLLAVADELITCVWPFYRVAAYRVKYNNKNHNNNNNNNNNKKRRYKTF